MLINKGQMAHENLATITFLSFSQCVYPMCSSQIDKCRIGMRIVGNVEEKEC